MSTSTTYLLEIYAESDSQWTMIDWNQVDWSTVVSLAFPVGSEDTLLLPWECMEAFAASPFISVSRLPQGDDLNKADEELPAIQEKPRASGTLMSSDGSLLYNNGFLYQKKFHKSDGSTILYCMRRFKDQCRGAGKISADGQFTVVSHHHGHSADPDACAVIMARRAFRDQTKEFEERTMENVRSEMQKRPFDNL